MVYLTTILVTAMLLLLVLMAFTSERPSPKTGLIDEGEVLRRGHCYGLWGDLLEFFEVFVGGAGRVLVFLDCFFFHATGELGEGVVVGAGSFTCGYWG